MTKPLGDAFSSKELWVSAVSCCGSCVGRLRAQAEKAKMSADTRNWFREPPWPTSI